MKSLSAGSWPWAGEGQAKNGQLSMSGKNKGSKNEWPQCPRGSKKPGAVYTEERGRLPCGEAGGRRGQIITNLEGQDKFILYPEFKRMPLTG